MEIKEGTLNNQGTSVIITDSNKNHYEYGMGFRLDKKVNGRWREVDEISEATFTLQAFKVDENNKLELNQGWEHIYGSLPNGSYRLVKSVCEENNCNIKKYLSVEFTI